MSYRIEYDSHLGKYEIRKEYPGRRRLLLAGAFSLFLLYTFSCWEDGAEVIRNLLIPGNDTVTVQAFQNMKSELSRGTHFGEALYGFCSFVIHGA